MARAKNTIKNSEVSSTPIKLRYSVTYASNSLDEVGITANVAVNTPYNVTMSSGILDSMATYRTIRQVYYQQAISGSVLNSASFWDPSWVSTAASGTLDQTNYDFPIGDSGSVLIFAVPSSQFGEQISRKTFSISSVGFATQFNIVDDGNGNLIDTLNSNIHVGNLFYAQGIAVITNNDYVVPPAVIDNVASQLDEPLITQNNDNIII